MTHTTNAAEWVTSIIHDFCNSPANSLQDAHNERAWDTPLIGFANGADPIFTQYKDVVGTFYMVRAAHGLCGRIGDLWPVPDGRAVRIQNPRGA